MKDTEKYYCENCLKEIVGTTQELDGGYVCQDCYEEAMERFQDE
jgi:DNA-directed RNA polymerase subunit RPC12/RpoP